MRIHDCSPPRRDAAAVIVVTLTSIVIAIHFDLDESLYALTLREERLQLDERPFGLLVLSIGLIMVVVAALRAGSARPVGTTNRGATTIGNARTKLQASVGYLRVQEDERKHLACELHDELGQYLNVLKLDAVSIRELQFARRHGCG